MYMYALSMSIFILYQADPEQNWAKVSMKGDDGTTEKVPVASEFIKYLGDLSHAVRMYCAKAVQG